MTEAILIMPSIGSEHQAITIAEELVQQELASSINILPTMRSIYRFNGKIFDDEENMLVIKTTSELFDQVSMVIHQMHTYEIPEVMGVNIRHCPETFLRWVQDTVHPLAEAGLGEDGSEN